MSVDRKNDPAIEAAWVARTQRQDLDAFSKIVDAYHSRVLGFVRRMVRNDEESRDLTQEVFIRAFQAIQKFDGRSSLRTWLFRIAYNLCVDRARRNDRAPITSSIDNTVEDEETREFADDRWNPEDLVMNQELGTVVESALETMSEKLRTVLLLHDKEDMAYEEISTVVGIPVGTVKSRLFLARAHMQQSVGRYLTWGRA
ncbi:MAG: sigma-70 family RNA polymerase sigma factor [Armatimonadota bacterium]